MKRRGKLADRADRLMRGDAMKATSSVRKAAAILLCASFVCLGAACTAKEGSQPTLQGEEAEYPPVADDLHLRGQRLSVEAGRLSSDQVTTATPARICVVASSACFEAPQYYGSNPQAESVELQPGRSAVLFRATASAGGSGSTTALWILDLQDGRFVSLTPEIQLSGQSEYALWNERDISTAPILVTADYVYGVGETHFSRHRFRIRAYMLEAAREASGMPEYNLRTDFVTDERYPSFDETDRIDVLSNERSNVLAQLRGPGADVTNALSPSVPPPAVDRSLPPAIDSSTGGISIQRLGDPLNPIIELLRNQLPLKDVPGWKKIEQHYGGTHKSADGRFQLVIEDEADNSESDVVRHRVYYSDGHVTRVELGKGRVYAAITPDSRWILLDHEVIDVRNWRRYDLSKSLGGYVVLLGISDDGQRMFLRHHVCPFDCTNIPETYYELNFPELR